jgi:hypothetical protein
MREVKYRPDKKLQHNPARKNAYPPPFRQRQANEWHERYSTQEEN